MAAGDPVSIDATLKVLNRSGTTRGTVSCQELSWTFGNGVDTPDLSATVNTAESALAANADLFDDAMAVVMFSVNGAAAVAAGSPFLVLADDLALIGGDDQKVSNAVSVSAKSALMVLAEWQVTPAEGVFLRRSPRVIYFGWTHPSFDDSAWDSTPTRVTRASVATTAPKYNQPTHWENALSDWIYDGDGTAGGLTLIRPGSSWTPSVNQQTRLATTADEEHRVHLYGPGYGGIVNETSKQETGYTHRNDFDRVLTASTAYYPTFEMTTVDSVGGDGFDALSYYMAPIGTDDYVTDYSYHSGNSGVKVWRQDKDDPRPGMTAGKILTLLRTWNQTWMPAASASCNTVTFSFTASLDSNGAAFADLPEMSWAVGTPVTQVMADLSDRVDFDCHLDPTDGHLVVDCYNRKGSDLSSSVPLVKGNTSRNGNILSYTASRRPRSITRASVLTEDGYTTKIDTSLESTVPARSSYLETQQSASAGEGKQLAGRVITEDGLRNAYSGTLTAVEGAIPGVNFNWGDYVSAPNRSGTASVRTVVKHGGARSGDSEPTFTVEMV